MWKPLGNLHVTTKMKILCECRCGKHSEVRARELIDGKSMCCRSCSSKLKMQKVPYEQRVALAKKASLAAALVLAQRQDKYYVEYGIAFKQLLSLGASAKQRCTNPNSIAYSNYGGRGVKFGFPSVRSFAQWVADNLGTKPSMGYSIDRVDNNRHYEAGNLRWATASEQARNKRQYKRTKNGERIRQLKELRPDLTYETIRLWIVQGATNDDIQNKAKYARTRL